MRGSLNLSGVCCEGDIIPADLKLIVCEGVKVDQAAMTGESLTVSKEAGDLAYSGTTVKMGECEGVVVSTGEQTFFGKTASLIGETNGVSHFQKVLTRIGSFCVVLIMFFEIVLLIVMFPAFRYNYRRGINNVLVLLVGGVVSLATPYRTPDYSSP